MKFEEKTIKGKKVFLIDNKAVSEKAYNTLKSEYEVKEDNCETEKCPRCQMIFEMAQDVWSADDEEEAFEILKDIINMVEDATYTEAYKTALQNQIEIMQSVVDDIGEEDDK